LKAERFRQIRNLYDATMERGPESRHAFLREACHGDEDLLVEVGKLLIAQGQPTAWIDDGVLGESLPRLEGRRIGPYQILRQLGEGGMGKVYLAARGDARVALKIVRSESATEEVLRRFRREREILESLDHPNIARILDGGTTNEGLPYLVMDFVDGQPIDKYCDERQLDLDARLQLFRDVCAAVHFAHEHRIVHRDLKPTNILVTNDGVVKLLDFGISKLASEGAEGATALTRTDLLLMTPEYASPEQVSGQPATPATDVYALGVVLYELLTGRRPYRMRSRLFREMVRVICEEAPTRPSTAVLETSDDPTVTPDTVCRLRGATAPELKKRLAGDIDCILMKSLEKIPAQRYRSAGQFAEEVRLHLAGKAVLARQQAFLDVSARFLSQNWWWLGISAALVAAIATGILVIPRAALLAALGIAAVLVAGYYLATWQRGEPYARRAMTDVGRFLPVTAIAMILEYQILPWMSENPFAWKIIAVVFLIAMLANWINLFRWYSRGRLGPLVLELRSPFQRVRSWLAFGIPLFLFVLLAQKNLRTGLDPYRILWIALAVAFVSPVLILFLLPRIEFRQRGFVTWTGIPCYWTYLISYSWESGGGKLAGKADTLFLRFKGDLPTNLKIPLEDREKVNALLERQAFEWPS
jgi:serine/threonine protein kinase